jgi:hypothetical protein
MGRNLREYLPPAAVTAVGLALSMLLHSRLGFWSPIQIGDVLWIKKLNLHLTVYPYTIRPFQTWATVWLHDLTSLPIRESFFFFQFSLTFILGLVLYAYLKKARLYPHLVAGRGCNAFHRLSDIRRPLRTNPHLG